MSFAFGVQEGSDSSALDAAVDSGTAVGVVGVLLAVLSGLSEVDVVLLPKVGGRLMHLLRTGCNWRPHSAWIGVDGKPLNAISWKPGNWMAALAPEARMPPLSVEEGSASETKEEKEESQGDVGAATAPQPPPPIKAKKGKHRAEAFLPSAPPGLATYEPTPVPTLFAFGQNTYSELLCGHRRHSTLPSECLQLPTGAPLAVAAGNEITAVISSTNRVYVAGFNTNGQCGVDSSENHIPTLTPVVGLPPKVVCMRCNKSCLRDVVTIKPMAIPSLFLSPFLLTPSPSPSPFLQNVAKVSLANGCEHMFVITTDGLLYGCGNNAHVSVVCVRTCSFSHSDPTLHVSALSSAPTWHHGKENPGAYAHPHTGLEECEGAGRHHELPTLAGAVHG